MAVRAAVYHGLARQLQLIRNVLHKHRAKPLAYAACSGFNMHFAAAYFKPYPARIRQTHAHARVFHGAGNAREPCALVSILHGLKRFNKAGGIVRNLAVRQHLPRAYGVYVAYLPRAYAYFVRHAV